MQTFLRLEQTFWMFDHRSGGGTIAILGTKRLGKEAFINKLLGNNIVVHFTIK